LSLAERIAEFGRRTAEGASPEAPTDAPMCAAGGLTPPGWVVVGPGPDGVIALDPGAMWQAAVEARAALVAERGPEVRFDLRRWSRMKYGVEAPFLDGCYDPTNGAASAGDEVWGEIDGSPLFLLWPAESRARLEERLAAQEVSP
jgi:hypothetical protein